MPDDSPLEPGPVARQPSGRLTPAGRTRLSPAVRALPLMAKTVREDQDMAELGIGKLPADFLSGAGAVGGPGDRCQDGPDPGPGKGSRRAPSCRRR